MWSIRCRTPPFFGWPAAADADACGAAGLAPAERAAVAVAPLAPAPEAALALVAGLAVLPPLLLLLLLQPSIARPLTLAPMAAPPNTVRRENRPFALSVQ